MNNDVQERHYFLIRRTISCPVRLFLWDKINQYNKHDQN